MGFPIMDGAPATNVYEEHVYKIRATFAASSELTYRSKNATIAKTTTTTFTITLPQTYAEITEFSVGQKCAASVIPLQYAITTNNVATDGTIVLTTKESAVSGAATAPASGDVVYITLGVSQHPLNDRFTG